MYQKWIKLANLIKFWLVRESNAQWTEISSEVNSPLDWIFSDICSEFKWILFWMWIIRAKFESDLFYILSHFTGGGTTYKMYWNHKNLKSTEKSYPKCFIKFWISTLKYWIKFYQYFFNFQIYAVWPLLVHFMASYYSTAIVK